MKKLMFAAAAIAAGVAVADVTSANIVGYMSNVLSNGFQSVSPGFVTIGVDGYRLSDLKVDGVPSATRTSYVQIQMLDSDGVAEEFYGWWKGGQAPHNKGTGWYAGNSIVTKENDIIFEKGQGLYITAIDGVTLSSSGEVLQNDFPIALSNGFQTVANPYPTEIKLSSITVDGVPSATRTSYVQIQMLDSDGIAEEFYGWWKGGQAPHNKGTGWYAGNNIITKDNDITFSAGQALYITGIDGSVLTFKSPIKSSTESVE